MVTLVSYHTYYQEGRYVKHSGRGKEAYLRDLNLLVHAPMIELRSSPHEGISPPPTAKGEPYKNYTIHLSYFSIIQPRY